MSAFDTLLVSAIVALATAIAVLWRQNASLTTQWRDDQTESSRFIFALLQRIAVFRGQDPPPTNSTAAAPQFDEAKKLAAKELNGELERLVKQYLESVPPPDDRVSFRRIKG